MFDNIGDKIKTLAKVLTVLGIIVSIIYGIVLMVLDEKLIFAGFLVIILGSLLFWIGSFTLYGFGEIIKQLEYSNSNSRKLYDLLKEKDIKVPINNSQPAEKKRVPQESEHKWLCNSCGKLRDTSPCPYCGKE